MTDAISARGNEFSGKNITLSHPYYLSQIKLCPMPETDAMEDEVKTMFFYSKGKIYLYFLFATIFMVLGLLLVNIGSPFPLGIGAIGMALYLFISRIIMLCNKKPQLIINEKGIQIGKLPVYTWGVIGDVGFESRRNGKGYEQYLVLNVDGGKQEIRISDLDRNKKFLISHIERCRDRYRRLARV